MSESRPVSKLAIKSNDRATHVRELFGSAAARLGFATQADVSRALTEQTRRKQQGRPGLIGALMQEMGMLSPEQIAGILYQLRGERVPLSEDGIRLAARIRTIHAAASNTILFTGVDVDDGVSATATEVASALAIMEQGAVLLVDVNLRAPQVHKNFQISQAPGLMEILDGRVPLDAALQPTPMAGLSVLPVGDVAGDFASQVMSARCQTLFDSLRDRFHYLVLDAGPVVRCPETSILAARSDGVVVVLRAGERSKSQLTEVTRLLTGLRATLTGVVLTVPRARGHA